MSWLRSLPVFNRETVERARRDLQAKAHRLSEEQRQVFPHVPCYRLRTAGTGHGLAIAERVSGVGFSGGIQHLGTGGATVKIQIQLKVSLPVVLLALFRTTAERRVRVVRTPGPPAAL